ncbi:MAG: DHH family phosphoesterase [Candidatus Dojkabacteria bacterium]
MDKIADKILKKIKESQKFLIVPDGKRVDHDCISSAIAIKLFLEKLGKTDSKIIFFGSAPSYISEFVTSNNIETKYIGDVDFNSYDLIFLLDAPQWERVLTEDYQTILGTVPLDKFVNIDHHEYGPIHEMIPEQVLSTVGEASTTKVIYDYLIKPSGIELTKDIAEMLYIGLASDSQFFKYGVQADTLSFGQLLINTGIDHYKVLNMLTTVEKGSVDYLVVAIKHTSYYPELKLMTLIVDSEFTQELTEKIGEDWESHDYSHLYYDVAAARIEGYDYGVMFRETNDGKGTRLSWRSRNYNTIALMEVFKKMNFKGGGHRNAGGGKIKDMTPLQVEANFKELLKEALE